MSTGEGKQPLTGRFIGSQERLDARIELISGLTQSFGSLLPSSSRGKPPPAPDARTARLLAQTAAEVRAQLDGVREEVSLAGGLERNYKDGADELLAILRHIPPEQRREFGLNMPDVDKEEPRPERATKKLGASGKVN